MIPVIRVGEPGKLIGLSTETGKGWYLVVSLFIPERADFMTRQTVQEVIQSVSLLIPAGPLQRDAKPFRVCLYLCIIVWLSLLKHLIYSLTGAGVYRPLTFAKTLTMNIKPIFCKYWVIVLLIIAAICDAVLDTMAYRFPTSVFSRFDPLFWDPSQSYLRLYKYPEMPELGVKLIYKLPILDTLRDARTLSKMLMVVSLMVMVAVYKSFTKKWYWDLVILGTIFSFIHQLFYRVIFQIL